MDLKLNVWEKLDKTKKSKAKKLKMQFAKTFGNEKWNAKIINLLENNNFNTWLLDLTLGYNSLRNYHIDPNWTKNKI